MNSNSLKELRKFGISFGIALGVWGVLLFWRGKAIYPYFFILSGIFLFLASISPRALKPGHRFLNTLFTFIQAIITTLALCFLFYLIVTPLGFLARLFGKDFLDLKFNKKATSYWVIKEKNSFDKKSYENQW